jgi:hypothetical protein
VAGGHLLRCWRGLLRCWRRLKGLTRQKHRLDAMSYLPSSHRPCKECLMQMSLKAAAFISNVSRCDAHLRKYSCKVGATCASVQYSNYTCFKFAVLALISWRGNAGQVVRLNPTKTQWSSDVWEGQ